MALGGRKPKPAHLRIVGGNAGKRPIPEEVSTAAFIAPPPPPEHLSPGAADLWRELAPVLVRAQLLTRGDVTALEMLCESYADWTEATDYLVDRGGPYYSTVSQAGATIWHRHPAAAARREAEHRLRDWLSEFGLTPTARTRAARAEVERPDDPAERYFT